jgi:hypothetical protein
MIPHTRRTVGGLYTHTSAAAYWSLVETKSETRTLAVSKRDKIAIVHFT